MTDRAAQHIVLCEGYDDRAFLSGIFEHLGRTSMRRVRGRGDVVDGWGDKLEDGSFGFAREGSPVISRTSHRPSSC